MHRRCVVCFSAIASELVRGCLYNTSAERDLYATEVQANTEIKKLTEHTKAVWLETCELLYQAARRDRRRNNQRDYADDIQQSHKHDCDTLGYP
jgi:uncharacterized protein YfcZ (UPF0381/DUF406 family)